MLKRFIVLALMPGVSAVGGLAFTALTAGTSSPGKVPSTLSTSQSAGAAVNAATRADANVRPLSRALLAPAATSPPKPPATTRPHPTVLPRRAVAARPQPTRRVTAPPAPPSSTPQQRLDQALSRIQGYQASDATWVLQAKDGYWGTADWYTNTIWISPSVPSNRVFDVAVHEWSHLKSVKDYGGDVNLAVNEMNRYFGGSGLTGAERAADCMARLEGADWTHYTSCSDSRWRQGAARLLGGGRL